MYLGNHIGDIGCAITHLGPQLLGVTLLDVSADGLNPGPVGWRAFFLVAPAPEDFSAQRLGQRSQLLCGAGLAYPGFSGKQDHAALAGQDFG